MTEVSKKIINKVRQYFLYPLQYDEAPDNLKKLLDKKKVLQAEELMTAGMKSSHSYEEILRYIQPDSSEEQE